MSLTHVSGAIAVPDLYLLVLLIETLQSVSEELKIYVYLYFRGFGTDDG